MLNYYYELNICCVKKKKNYWVVHKCCRRLEKEGCILCMGALSARLGNAGWCLWRCLCGSCFGSLSVIVRCGMNEEAWKARSQVGSGIEGKDVWARLWASYPSSALTRAIPLSVFCLLELTMRFYFSKVQRLKKDIRNLTCMFRSWLFRSWLFKTTPWSSLNLFLVVPPKTPMTQASSPGHEWRVVGMIGCFINHTHSSPYTPCLQLETLALPFIFLFKNVLPHPLLLHKSIYCKTPTDLSLHWILKAHTVCSTLGAIIMFCFGLLCKFSYPYILSL